jgi:hypothetical protein
MYQTGYHITGYYQTGYYLGPTGIIPVSSFSYFKLLVEARQLLGDMDEDDCPTRYPDAMLINALNRGLQELARIRPDAFYDLFSSNNLNVPEITDSVALVGQFNWLETFILELKFWPPLVYYVTGQMDLVEDEYVPNMNRHPSSSKAAKAMQVFRRHTLAL